jgi:DNA-directed RNA polymerase sigma subunit (sigma70/sigma32)
MEKYGVSYAVSTRIINGHTHNRSYKKRKNKFKKLRNKLIGAHKPYLGKDLSILSERERKILALKLGTCPMNMLTLKEIGDIIGLTYERIRQILHEINLKLLIVKGVK